MKKALSLMALISVLGLHSQTIADFETFSLTLNSVYQSTASLPFETSNAIFQYNWDPSFGGYWAGGFAYTNKYDSTTVGFGNLYGVKAYKGYNGSSAYVVAQNRGVIKLKSPFKTVDGFYITNTTYAFKSIKNGDQFARKFGDTTGTHSGTTIAQGSYPDFFKVTAKGYLGGTIKSDSSVFYLADYRFSNNTQDYVVGNWQWFNTSNLGLVDSIKFFMYSTDANQFGINTPAFFAMDDFKTSAPNTVGFKDETDGRITVFPNPFTNQINIINEYSSSPEATFTLINSEGKIIFNQTSILPKYSINLPELNSGIYFLQVETGDKKIIKQLIKN